MKKENGYYDFSIDIDELLAENATLDEAFYIKDLKQRKLFLNAEINQFSIEDIIKHIMQFNAEDKDIPIDKRKPIILYVNSIGGEVDSGFALIDVIQASKTPVYTINLGFQYSMGFLIGLAGHKRFATQNAKFLMHDGSNYLYGSGTKIQDQMEFQKKVESRIKDYIISRSKLTSEEYDSKLRVEWYMYTDEAKEKGFTDYIIGKDCDIDAIVWGVMEEYTGFKELIIDDNGINSVFNKEGFNNTFGCLQNEYLVAKDKENNVLGIFKCRDNKLHKVPYKSINSKYLGEIKPRNTQQRMAIDMLYDNNTTIKIITGRFGSGKDLLMCSAAVDLIEHNKFEKIVYVRNNIEVKDSKPIGYLPGTNDEKLLPFAMPLADKLGGVDGLSLMIAHGQVEVVHLGFIRGRDIKNSIVICSEAENMTKEHIQLLLGRIGEGSNLWINGDFKQCDAKIFERNSGLMAAVNKLKGHNLFGYVKLLKTERSETAAMADLLD